MRYLTLLVLMSALLAARPTHAALAVPDAVLTRFSTLASMYPQVARGIKTIEPRTGVSWVISYERTVIYVNVDKSDQELTAALTTQFARRAYAVTPWLHKSFRTWRAFAAALCRGVR